MMKKMMMVLAILLSLAMLAACSESGQSAPASASQEAASSANSVPVPEETGESQPDSAPEKEEQPDAASSAPAQTPPSDSVASGSSNSDPASAGDTPAADSAEQPGQAPETPSSGTTASTSYGAVPFELATGTDKWWKIDSTDTAYWAVQENINAMRAEGGLPALTMDDALSTTASARCESFVAGGAFDHSGMVTKSEICAAGPLFSAADVCTVWQNSEDHYANIMRSDITRMGVGCWFCEMDGSKYTYWVVTFE